MGATSTACTTSSGSNYSGERADTCTAVLVLVHGTYTGVRVVQYSSTSTSYDSEFGRGGNEVIHARAQASTSIS